jgi:SAM-dependent methyltransferase
MRHYTNKDYWNSLVGESMLLKEVGWPEWTEAYNRARYKLAEKQNVRSYKKYLKDSPKRILEIGCGIGYWTNVLTNQFPEAEYTGLDISQQGIEKLKARYNGRKNISFINMDVTTPGLDIEHKKFDLIVCYEVLLHIVDDKAWANAVKNILAHLSDEGVLMLSDPFTIYKSFPYREGDNCKVRTKENYEQHIADNKCRVVAMDARTYLLDNNFDFKSRLAAKAWKGFFHFYNKLLSVQSEFLGSILGNLAYGFDSVYTKVTGLGHSCRLVIIKKTN